MNATNERLCAGPDGLERRRLWVVVQEPGSCCGRSRDPCSAHSWYRRHVIFGLTTGEIILIVFIFALVYGAGHLPALAERLGGKRANDKTVRSSDD